MMRRSGSGICWFSGSFVRLVAKRALHSFRTVYPLYIHLDGNLTRDTPPEIAPSFQHRRRDIDESTGFDDELLVRLPALRNTRHRRIRELMRVRISGLEEGCKSSSEPFVNKWFFLLDDVDLVPLSLASAWHV